MVVESSPTASSLTFPHALLRIGGWSALLALGISLALITSQNRALQRRVLTVRQGVVAVPGSIVAGFAAGAAGQFLFAEAARFSTLEVIGRVMAWTLLGGLLGRGMALFVPNLKPLPALFGGAFGGAAGAVSFLWIAGELGDVAGRFAGAALLGYFIGLMIALVETVFREAWLQIGYGSREFETVTLGPQPVSIGGDQDRCTIYAWNAPPVAFRFKLEQGRILCEDVTAHTTGRVQPGDQKTVGNVTITVCAGGRQKRGEVTAKETVQR